MRRGCDGDATATVTASVAGLAAGTHFAVFCSARDHAGNVPANATSVGEVVAGHGSNHDVP